MKYKIVNLKSIVLLSEQRVSRFELIFCNNKATFIYRIVSTEAAKARTARLLNLVSESVRKGEK